MEHSSIESRTRASFSRVKRDIEALKNQVAKLRVSDEQVDRALSGYARTDELYEQLKRIDERFSQLSDNYATAPEFEKAIGRLVKEIASLTKRMTTLERSDFSSEVTALRKDFDVFSRTALDRKDFDGFVDRVSSRIAKLDTFADTVEDKVKRIDPIEKRLASFEGLEQESKRITEHEKILKKLDGVDAKSLEKRFSALESSTMTEDTVRTFVARELENAVRVEELNEKIDEFNAALDTAAERARVDALEASLADLKKKAGSADRIAAVEASIADLKNVDLKKKTDSADRIAGLESAVAELKKSGSADRIASLEASFADLKKKAGSADRIAAVETTVADLKKSTGSADRIASLESSVIDRIAALEKGLETERQKMGVHLMSASDELDTVSSKLHQFESYLGELRESIDDDVVTVAEFNEKVDEFNAALESAADRKRLDALEAKLASIEKDPALTKRLDAERHATNAQITTAIEEIDALTARIDELESTRGADARLDALEKRFTALESSPSSITEGRIDALTTRIEELESTESTDRDERISDVEAQLRAVIDDMGGSSSSVDERVVESIVHDITSLKKTIEELSDDVELVASSNKKGAQRVESFDHLHEEIEFLRTNVAMQADLESLREQIEKSPKGKDVKDNRMSILADDLQHLIERQSELEKKILAFETQAKHAAPRDPLWGDKEANVEISEKVPLREPKRSTKPKAAEKPAEPAQKPAQKKPADKEKSVGTMGRMRRWMVDFFTEEVDEDEAQKRKDELY